MLTDTTRHLLVIAAVAAGLAAATGIVFAVTAALSVVGVLAGIIDAALTPGQLVAVNGEPVPFRTDGG